MGLRRLLEACQVLEKVALNHSSKSTKYELEGSYDDLVHDLSWAYHTPLCLGLYQRNNSSRSSNYDNNNNNDNNDNIDYNNSNMKN